MTKKNIIIGIVALITMLLIISNITFAKETVSFPEQHSQLDEALKAKFDSWVAQNGTKDFCMPKAKILKDEIEARQALGDDITQLETRYNRVLNECKEVVKTVLFQ